MARRMTSAKTVSQIPGSASPPSPCSPEADHRADRRAARSAHVAWALTALALWFVLAFRLVPALLAGLAVYVLIHRVTARLAGGVLSHSRARLLVVALLGLVSVASALLLALGLLAFLTGRLGDLPGLLDQLAAALDTLRDQLGGSFGLDAGDDIRAAITAALRTHASALRRVGGDVGRAVLHGVAGLVIGALIACDPRRPTTPWGQALAGRLQRLTRAFEQIVGAQVKISALNTLLAALYLLVLLPLGGVTLPLRKTLVGVTFVAGLLPLVGNLLSNTAIVLVSLQTSARLALLSLGFLVGVHKLEYFANARIVAGAIHAAAWELLVALVCAEAAFGLSGVVLAPILYAYVKAELADRGLV